MDNKVRQHLCQLIKDYGLDITKDTRRLESLLKDYTLGQYKREVFLCVQAAREGVIDALQNNEYLPYQVVAARLTKQLHEDYGLDLHAAKWAVGSWVVALGLTKKFPAKKQTTIKPPEPEQPRPTPVPPPTVINITHHKAPIITQKLVAQRYADQSDGTVLDTKTGLHWMRFSLGQTWNGKVSLTEAKRYNWQEAQDSAIKLNQTTGFAGYHDWRVPTVDELKTLVERNKKPAINHTIFPATPLSLFWTCSPAPHVPHSAWAVYFYGGSSYWYGKTSYYYVRLVRS